MWIAIIIILQLINIALTLMDLSTNEGILSSMPQEGEEQDGT